jgi:hypothetical protein
MNQKKQSYQPLVWSVFVLLAFGLAIADQLRLPPDQRTWHGLLWGRVPYDLRRPTLQRVRAEFWNPETRQLFTPHAFGVGWGINLYPLFH